MKSITKAWAFLIAFSITLIVLGHSYGGREGLLLALVVALATNSFVYFYEDRRILSLIQGKVVEGQDSFGLFDIVRRLSIKARVPAPRIILLPDLAPQAGVVGHGLSSGSILLTQGLLNRFSAQEVEVILAYQVACIKNLNTLAYAAGSFAATLGLAVTETLDLVIRFLLVEKKDPNSYISQLFTRTFSPVIGLILRLSVRPSFYLDADKTATQLACDPQQLAHALWKLGSYADTLPYKSPLFTSHIFIVSPLTQLPWTRVYRTHPSVESRIRALIGHHPI